MIKDKLYATFPLYEQYREETSGEKLENYSSAVPNDFKVCKLRSLSVPIILFWQTRCAMAKSYLILSEDSFFKIRIYYPFTETLLIR